MTKTAEWWRTARALRKDRDKIRDIIEAGWDEAYGEKCQTVDEATDELLALLDREQEPVIDDLAHPGSRQNHPHEAASTAPQEAEGGVLADKVDEILGEALRCPRDSRYRRYRHDGENGRFYVRWGLVQKDIRAILSHQPTEPQEAEVEK